MVLFDEKLSKEFRTCGVYSVDGRPCKRLTKNLQQVSYISERLNIFVKVSIDKKPFIEGRHYFMANTSSMGRSLSKDLLDIVGLQCVKGLLIKI